MTPKSQILATIVFFTLLSQVIAHSYLTSPTSRSNQAETQTGCRGPTCFGPCDIPLALAKRAPIVSRRGDSLKVDWPRNNHPGGFIRFAWAPTSQSDSHAAFDAHVQQINCHEIGSQFMGGCVPQDPSQPNEGGSGPTDGSTGACNTNITIPTDLTDGRWTLQWAWFGGGYSLGDYYSCVDFTISGGAAVAPITPVFKGGDYGNPGTNKCKYFNTNKLHVCVNESCSTATVGVQSGAPAAGQLGQVNSSSTTARPQTTGVATTGVATTGVATTGVATTARATTGAATTGVATTGAATTARSTTGRSSTTGVATTGVATTGVATTGVATTARATTGQSSQQPTSSCAATNKQSRSVAEIKSVETWGTNFHMVVSVTVAENVLSDWIVGVSLPTSSFQVSRFFNSGILKCKEDNVAYFSPVASWANNKAKGSTFEVEFIGTVSDVNILDDIKSNSRAQVFTN